MLSEKIMRASCFGAALLSIFAVALISIFLFGNGIPAMREIGIFKFLFSSVWRPNSNEFGIFPMIVASLYVTALSLLMGVPVGIFSAVFLAYYCPKKIYKPVKTMMELLAGIPSIVYGLFALVVLVPIFQVIFPGTSGKSLLTASVILAIMILPTVITVSESSIRSVNEAIYHGSLALGSTKEIAVMRAIVPAASSGVISSVILALGRAIGETMAVIMVAGNQPVIPSKITSGVRTMTANIVLEMGYATDLHREALIATAVVLFVFILIINLAFSAMKRRSK